MSRSIRPYELVSDTKLGKRFLKERLLLRAAAVEPIRKLCAIVGLNTFNSKGKLLNHMAQEYCGRISVVLFKCLKIAKAAVFVYEGILIPFSAFLLPNNADFWDEFDIDLSALARILHLFIRLGNILGIWQLHSHLASFAQESVKTGNGSGVPSLPELDPEYHQTCIGVPATHIVDELNLLRTVLVGMMVRPV